MTGASRTLSGTSAIMMAGRDPVVPILYRPFDVRATLLHRTLARRDLPPSRASYAAHAGRGQSGADFLADTALPRHVGPLRRGALGRGRQSLCQRSPRGQQPVPALPSSSANPGDHQHRTPSSRPNSANVTWNSATPYWSRTANHRASVDRHASGGDRHSALVPEVSLATLDSTCGGAVDAVQLHLSTCCTASSTAAATPTSSSGRLPARSAAAGRSGRCSPTSPGSASAWPRCTSWTPTATARTCPRSTSRAAAASSACDYGETLGRTSPGRVWINGTQHDRQGDTNVTVTSAFPGPSTTSPPRSG